MKCRITKSKLIENITFLGFRSYPGCEVYSRPSVEQQRGNINITVVSSNMQRSEATLLDNGIVLG